MARRAAIVAASLALFAASAFGLARADAGACLSTYAPPRILGRIEESVQEESGIVSSRKNPKVLWVHSDNFDVKKVFALSVAPETFGRVVGVVDLSHLPGISLISDFEDMSIAQCPFQADSALPSEEREWCLWIGEVGNNKEWRKGAFIYTVNEPTLPSDHAASNITTFRPDEATVFHLQYEGYRYQAGPDVEAMVVADDGSRIWLFQKTFANNGEGPAGIYQSPLLEDSVGDRCTRNWNGTWTCDLAGSLPGRYMLSHPFHWHVSILPNVAGDAGAGGKRQRASGALRKPRSRDTDSIYPISETELHPLKMKRVREMRNPEPACCKGISKIRNISAADMTRDGKRLLLSTYGGIFEYTLDPPFDVTSLQEGRQLTYTNRDGSHMDGGGKFWLVCASTAGPGGRVLRLHRLAGGAGQCGHLVCERGIQEAILSAM